MIITDELREYADRLSDEAARKSEHGFSPVAMKLEGIADHIDAEHERTVGFCKRLEDAAAKREDVEIFGVEYTVLPLDAHGEYIHIGDVMEWCDSGETLTVEGIGSDVLFYIDGENAEWTAARNKRHHHEPTVEDVLRECCHKYHSLLIDDMNDAINGVERDYIAPDEIIAEYAAKLRLAKEGE